MYILILGFQSFDKCRTCDKSLPVEQFPASKPGIISIRTHIQGILNKVTDILADTVYKAVQDLNFGTHNKICSQQSDCHIGICVGNKCNPLFQAGHRQAFLLLPLTHGDSSQNPVLSSSLPCRKDLLQQSVYQTFRPCQLTTHSLKTLELCKTIGHNITIVR